MKKIMNSADTFVDDSLQGLVAAHADKIKFCAGSQRGIVRAQKKEKVAIISGGGYGHLPTFTGFVGEGFLDGCAVGNVFTSPSSEAIYETAKEMDAGKGCLFLFGNYFGDTMNFEMARDMLEMDDIRAEIVKAADDILSAPHENKENRRGIAGIYFPYKMAGAKAEEGASLDEVKRIAEKAVDATYTVGFAFSPCQLPGQENPIFEIGDDEMEMGMGIHGEPGVFRSAVKTSAEIARDIVERFVKERNDFGEIAVLINGLGGTSREELAILYKDVKACMEAEGMKIHKAILGEFATSMEMIGASVSICRLDDELKELLSRKGEMVFSIA